MNNNRKISNEIKVLKKAFETYEKQRLFLTAKLIEIIKDLPFSETEVCRRVGISRSAWSTYKEKGMPYDKIFKVFEFLNGIKVDNQSIIL